MKKFSAKRALLLSVLSMVICVSMLIGSTFAWFTDSATANVNTIQSGNLDVDLQVKNADGEWVSADGTTLSFVKLAGHEDEAILWEPGCTYNLPELRVVNNGNLKLKYKVVVTGIDGDTGLASVIDWTINGIELETEQVLDPEATSEFTISGHMQETAGNEYRNLKLEGISITVYATQATGEYDSNGNTYDEGAEYPNVVTVTPDTLSDCQWNKSDVTYYFAPGTYNGLTIHSQNSAKNISYIAMKGAKFTGDVNIGYHAGDRDAALAESSTIVVKGFDVDGNLTIVSRDKNVVVESNNAKQIKLQMHDVAGDIKVLNNTMDGSAKYGFWLDPFVTGYDLTITGNTFKNISSHAIGVQGHAGRGTDYATAANSIIVTGNNFVSYGAGKAAFKIWEDTKLAPNDTDPLNDAAKALAKAVKENNTFASDLADSCVVADFFGKSVAFN